MAGHRFRHSTVGESCSGCSVGAVGDIYPEERLLRKCLFFLHLFFFTLYTIYIYIYVYGLQTAEFGPRLDSSINIIQVQSRPSAGSPLPSRCTC